MEEKATMMTMNKVKPYLAMVSLQFGFAGMYVITMVALNQHMNHYILAVYRHLVATLVIAPFAFVLERKIRPKMTLGIFLRITALGFIEPVIDQNLYYIGMSYTSATLAAATVNVLPAITFVLALIFRLEIINLKKIPSVAKLVGTMIMIPGAIIMTIYKGPALFGGHVAAAGDADKVKWVIGTLMLLARCWGWSGFVILQSFTLKKYPAELSLTAMICFMGTLGGTAVSLVMERDINAWKIGFDAKLLAAVYSGVVCSGVAYYVQGVVIKERGPVFTTAFSPLGMIITAILSTIILHEKVFLGNVLGTVLIIFGLYTVLWGKSKDRTASSSADDLSSESLELPVTDASKATELPVINAANPTMIKIDGNNTSKLVLDC